jgi:hypothetical protein
MTQGHFIVTDISGYTEFLTHSELDLEGDLGEKNHPNEFG